MSDDFWERAAKVDPLWAVLSDPSKRNRQWDLPSFFATGEREITLLLYQLRTLGHAPTPGRAMDFGCGVGRLTQALAPRFAEVIGVDASETMIQLAEQLNRFRGRVRYILNDAPSLQNFGTATFDFVYSDIVLQHLPAPLASGYVAEFLRILVPGGIAVFQLSSHKRDQENAPVRPVHMPEDAYRARIQWEIVPPDSMRVGETAAIEVDVTNISPLEWNQQLTGTINVGNHWRNARGEMIVQDDARSGLPIVLASGQSVRVPLVIRTPAIPGICTCEVDLVHEGISWFADLGTNTQSHRVDVISDQAAAVRSEDAHVSASERPFPDIYAMLPEPSAAEIGPFPMFGVPRQRVLGIIRDHGADPFFIEPDERGGPEWHGYRYFVKKLEA